MSNKSTNCKTRKKNEIPHFVFISPHVVIVTNVNHGERTDEDVCLKGHLPRDVKIHFCGNAE